MLYILIADDINNKQKYFTQHIIRHTRVTHSADNKKLIMNRRQLII